MAKQRTQKETVAILQKTYPKFNKVAASMAAHPERYGICYTKEAKEALGIKPKKKSDIRKKPHRVSVRLDDETYNWLMENFKNSTFTTMQDYLEAVVDVSNTHHTVMWRE